MKTDDPEHRNKEGSPVPGTRSGAPSPARRLAGLLVCSCVLLMSCAGNSAGQSSAESSDTAESFSDAGRFSENTSEESTVKDLSPAESTSSEEENSSEEELVLTVTGGEYLKVILGDLVSLGIADSVEALLEQTASLQPEDNGQLLCYTAMQEDTLRASRKAFLAEGYIAPGTYAFPAGTSSQEVLSTLLSSWDSYLMEEQTDLVMASGLSVDEILTAASLVEYESSFTQDDSVKPLVASVIFNRLKSGTPLQLDVTVFYLQEGLSPYRDPADYEYSYNTYESSSLPPGPIGSPTKESVEAVLSPASTDYFFFIYDEEGNYYFAEDYDTHLENVEKYLN